MTTEVMLEDLGLNNDASPSEIQSTIEDKQSELEYMITAIDDEAVRQVYLSKINELKLTAKVLLEQQKRSSDADIPKNIHHLPLSPKTASEIKADNYASIKAKMSGRLIEDEKVEELKLEPIAPPVIKPKLVEKAVKPQKKKGKSLFAVVTISILISVGVLGFLINNGTLSISTSKEQALEIASVEMIRGEIDSYHQLLATTKLKVDSSLNKIPSSMNINRNAFKEFINSTIIVDMQGKIRMGDSLFNQGHYREATDILSTVKENSKLLLSEYNAVNTIISSSVILNDFDNTWTKNKNDYDLSRPTEIITADSSLSSAHIAIENKDFVVASKYMLTAIDNWQKANRDIQSQIAQVEANQQEQISKLAEQERIQQLAIENDKRLALEKETNELKRLALIEANKHSEAQAIKEQELEKIAIIEEADRLSQKLLPVSTLQPTYPKDARKSQIEGWVDFEFTVKSNGEVKDLVVTGSSPRRVFNKAAFAAFRKWTFAPLLKNGQSVERLNAKYRVEFQFE